MKLQLWGTRFRVFHSVIPTSGSFLLRRSLIYCRSHGAAVVRFVVGPERLRELHQRARFGRRRSGFSQGRLLALLAPGVAQRGATSKGQRYNKYSTCDMFSFTNGLRGVGRGTSSRSGTQGEEQWGDNQSLESWQMGDAPRDLSGSRGTTGLGDPGRYSFGVAAGQQGRGPGVGFALPEFGSNLDAPPPP